MGKSGMIGTFLGREITVNQLSKVGDSANCLIIDSDK
jgi:hypothetical protein